MHEGEKHATTHMVTDHCRGRFIDSDGFTSLQMESIYSSKCHQSAPGEFSKRATELFRIDGLSLVIRPIS
jgi:hypothetical protein